MESNVAYFFENEMNDTIYGEMLHFLESSRIKEGKFQGNEVLIEKLDEKTIVVYKEKEEVSSVMKTKNAVIFHLDQLVERLKELKNH